MKTIRNLLCWVILGAATFLVASCSTPSATSGPRPASSTTLPQEVQGELASIGYQPEGPAIDNAMYWDKSGMRIYLVALNREWVVSDLYWSGSEQNLDCRPAGSSPRNYADIRTLIEDTKKAEYLPIAHTNPARAFNSGSVNCWG